PLEARDVDDAGDLQQRRHVLLVVDLVEDRVLAGLHVHRSGKEVTGLDRHGSLLAWVSTRWPSAARARRAARGSRADRPPHRARPRKEKEALDRDAQPRRAAGAIGREGRAIGGTREGAPRRRAEDGARAPPSEQPARVTVALAAAGRRRVEQPDRHVHADDAGGARDLEDAGEVARHGDLRAGAVAQHDHPARATAVHAGHEGCHAARRQALRGGWPAPSASWPMVTSGTMSKTGRPVSRWMSAVYGGMLVHSSTMAPTSGWSATSRRATRTCSSRARSTSSSSSLSSSARVNSFSVSMPTTASGTSG